jgi:hypothetical protein
MVREMQVDGLHRERRLANADEMGGVMCNKVLGIRLETEPHRELPYEGRLRRVKSYCGRPGGEIRHEDWSEAPPPGDKTERRNG